MLSWQEFREQRPDLAAAGRELFYHYGVGLAFLSTVRKDGGPRGHSICPLILDDARLLAFLIPSPKLQDLRRDGRYSLHSHPMESNEDAFVLTGNVKFPADDASRSEAASAYWRERGREEPPGFDAQTLVEFFIDSCLLTRTDSHGDPAPRHTIWRHPSPSTGSG